MRHAALLLLLAPSALASACGKSAPRPAPIKVDGSSTVYPISEAVAEEWKKGHPTQVTVGVSGTGGGFKRLCAGEIDVADASRPIKQVELERCARQGIEAVEVPVAFDGIAVVVNPKNDWVDHLTVAELKLIWEPAAQGKIKRWSDVRKGWPDRELRLFGAGVDSGTYDYFTEAIVHREHASRGDFTSSEDDNVLVSGVAGDPLALGFFGLAYHEHNKGALRVVPIDDEKADNGAGPIAPSAATVRDGTYQPLSRPVFVYVATRSLERPDVAEFVQFYLREGPKRLIAEVGYIPLPERVYPLLAARVERRVAGSLFDGKGSQVGVSIEALLERQRGAVR